ncbi:LOW QUALITY PROTEIN: proton-coupled amino acid transporter 2-like [Paramacrobiotus metropolitanus]|uniref:LOW QUALITY PROTEIN: proton-coupled amino acid transporter 2-like n=1 Tax=Paramacrobiotus metropolitanus TaxID=2943436 RepID=UPI002445E4EA|nr:LOW QUALITY PROTEIN: proton-coupled amino acid transporter 2-like [Paramacrobiotus metropolitanus]
MSFPDGVSHAPTSVINSVDSDFAVSPVNTVGHGEDAARENYERKDVESERELDPFAHADLGEDRRNAQTTTTNLAQSKHRDRHFCHGKRSEQRRLDDGNDCHCCDGIYLYSLYAHSCELCPPSLQSRRKKRFGYGEVVQAAFRQSSYSKYANLSKKVVDLLIIVSQFGFCCVYIVYVATTLQDVIRYYTDVELPIQAYTAMVLPFLILLCYIRSLKILAPFSLAANLILCTCLVIIFVYVFGHLKSVDSSHNLPDGRNCRCLLGLQYTLSPHKGIYIVVILLVGLVVFYSYSLQFYVPFEILWPTVKKRLRTPLQVKIGEYLFRTGIVIFTFLLAVAIPKLGLFISLVGAVGSSSLALIFPPVLETVTYGWQNQGKLHWKLIKNAAIFIFGILGFVTGTYVAVLEIVLSFEKDATDSATTTALPTQAVPVQYLS